MDKNLRSSSLVLGCRWTQWGGGSLTSMLDHESQPSVIDRPPRCVKETQQVLSSCWQAEQWELFCNSVLCLLFVKLLLCVFFRITVQTTDRLWTCYLLCLYGFVCLYKGLSISHFAVPAAMNCFPTMGLIKVSYLIFMFSRWVLSNCLSVSLNSIWVIILLLHSTLLLMWHWGPKWAQQIRVRPDKLLYYIIYTVFNMFICTGSLSELISSNN